MQTDFERHTLAKLAALLQLQVHALSKMGLPADAGQADRDDLVRLVPDTWLKDLDRVDFPDLPAEEAEVIWEMAKARSCTISGETSA